MSNLLRNQEAKQSVISEIRERLDKAKSVVLVDARGLTVEQDTTLRQTLRKTGGIEYKVYKNTMLERAIKDTDFAGLSDYLSGPTAVGFSYDDATAAAAQINKNLKGMPKLEFKAIAIDGVVYDADQAKAIAEIPSREVLISRLLGSFKSPLASFARVVNAIAEKGPSDAAPAAEAAPVVEAVAEAAPVVEETPTAEAPLEVKVDAAEPVIEATEETVEAADAAEEA